LARLLYIGRNPERFRKELLAEFLPPFTADGKSALWEEVGRKFTGIDYREADLLARKEKKFVKACFPKEIPIEALSPEAQRMIGLPGEAARPAVKILTDAGFRYLHQVDPFDGGPHYGCKLNTIRWKEIGAFLEGATEVKIIL
jgi:arginine N-succinyltransferase